MSAQITSISDLKKRREKERHKSLVLDAYDRFERADKREIVEKRAEVERKARQRI